MFPPALERGGEARCVEHTGDRSALLWVSRSRDERVVGQAHIAAPVAVGQDPGQISAGGGDQQPPGTEVGGARRAPRLGTAISWRAPATRASRPSSSSRGVWWSDHPHRVPASAEPTGSAPYWQTQARFGVANRGARCAGAEVPNPWAPSSSFGAGSFEGHGPPCALSSPASVPDTASSRPGSSASPPTRGEP